MKLNEKKIKYIIREKNIYSTGKVERLSEIPKKAKELVSKLGIDMDILRKR